MAARAPHHPQAPRPPRVPVAPSDGGSSSRHRVSGGAAGARQPTPPPVAAQLQPMRDAGSARPPAAPHGASAGRRPMSAAPHRRRRSSDADAGTGSGTGSGDAGTFMTGAGRSDDAGGATGDDGRQASLQGDPHQDQDQDSRGSVTDSADAGGIVSGSHASRDGERDPQHRSPRHGPRASTPLPPDRRFATTDDAGSCSAASVGSVRSGAMRRGSVGSGVSGASTAVRSAGAQALAAAEEADAVFSKRPGRLLRRLLATAEQGRELGGTVAAYTPSPRHKAPSSEAGGSHGGALTARTATRCVGRAALLPPSTTSALVRRRSDIVRAELVLPGATRTTRVPCATWRVCVLPMTRWRLLWAPSSWPL